MQHSTSRMGKIVAVRVESLSGRFVLPIYESTASATTCSLKVSNDSSLSNHGQNACCSLEQHRNEASSLSYMRMENSNYCVAS